MHVYIENDDEDKVFKSDDIVAVQSKSSAVIEFVERSHELETIHRRLSSGSLVDVKEKVKYAHELTNWQSMECEAVLSALASDINTGLSSKRAADKLAANGPNIMPQSREAPIWFRFIMSFFSGFSLLLWFACAFVFISWEPFGTPPSNIYNLALAIVFLIIIVIGGLFNFYQEVMSARVISGFKTMIPDECLILRDGAGTMIPAADVVVGDIVLLKSGSRVPSDMRILQQSDLKIDTSMLTGENTPLKMMAAAMPHNVTMLQSRNIAFMGCNVVEGEGIGIVIAAGSENQLSRIAAEVAVATPVTGLQKEINRFVLIIFAMAFVVALAVVIEWAAYLNVDHYGYMKTGDLIANAISVFVAFIPEGLPLALQTGLAIIAHRLCADHKVIAKQLSIIQTVGSMSLLASDKTGTLTQNKMTLTAFITASSIVAVADAEQALTKEMFISLQMAAIFCNQAQINYRANTQTPRASFDASDIEDAIALTNNSARVVGGNGIDRALLEWMLPALDTVNNLKSTFSVKAIMPFSSATKISASVVARNAGASDIGSAMQVIVKGAPEYILGRCSTYMDANGNATPLTPDLIATIKESIEMRASCGERVIAVAKLELCKEEYPEEYAFKTDPEANFPMTGLMFLACASVSDPPRPEVSGAIQSLRRAGIKVVMVTGDAINTAHAIARQVGIVTKEAVNLSPKDAYGAALIPEKAILVEGPMLDTMTEANWNFVVSHPEIVFARVTPDQKLQIVKELKVRGERVGVTGDGVNDSPALKCADVGIAMNSGSDVARDASDIILLTDNFAAIPLAVQEGRLIFENLRKVIGYQIAAGCYSELIPVLATFFLGMPQPLSSFLMIIISCMTDVYAGIALMREPPEDAVMNVPPRDTRKEPLVKASLILYSYMWYGNLETIACFITYFLYMAERGPTGGVPNPVPADDDGHRQFPAGYTTSQLINAWNWGADQNNLGADNADASTIASSVYFVTIAVTQWGHLFAIRRTAPYFYDAIMDTHSKGGSVFSRILEELLASKPRVPLVCAILASALTIIFFTEVPLVQVSCGTASVPPKYWGMSIGLSIFIFMLNEGRKWAKIFVNSRWNLNL